jgi:teichuronic acid biosynthesis protein TuaE
MKVNVLSLQRGLLYLTILFSFSGPLFLSREIGAFHIFPLRIFLILQWLLFAGYIYFTREGHLQLSYKKVKVYLQYFAIWLGYAFISILWAADQIAAVKNVIFLFSGVSILFFLVYFFRNLNTLKWLYLLWLLIFVVLIPIGLWEVVTGNHLVVSGLSEEERSWVMFAPTTVFTNQNDYAAFIALTIPMILVWIRYYSKLYIRILGVLVLIGSLSLLIMTTSRSCYLAVFAGLAFWFIFLLQVKKKLITLVTVTTICILLLLAFPDWIQDTFSLVQAEISSLDSVVSATDDYGSNVVRKNLIKNALHFTAQSAGFGVGAGNAEYYMERYGIYPTGHITNVHNWWAEILANYGIFIFAGYVVLYISIFLNLWRAYKGINVQTEKMICEALLVGLISFFIASVSSSSIIAFPPQWIFFGFCLAFLNYLRNKELLHAHPNHPL